ncbi:DNA-binding transcriptional ArsR family regulator [Enterococcus sp. UD-01]
MWYTLPMENKCTNFKNDPVLLALQAASDPTRLNILTCLMLDGEKRITSETYNIVKSTLSHHIKLLKEANLITEIKTGTTKKYGLNQAYIEQNLPGLLELIRCRATYWNG